MTEQFELLVDLFGQADYEPRRYSGRGMMGRSCLGVICDVESTMLLRVIQAAIGQLSGDEEGFDKLQEVVEALENSSRDNMGMSMIVYWPSIEWEEPEEEESEDEED